MDCVGYTKCTEFVSDTRYNEKLAEAFGNVQHIEVKKKSSGNKKEQCDKKKNSGKKKKQNKKTQKTVSSNVVKVKATNKNEIKKAIVKKKLPENAIGSDPRLRDILEQFKYFL